ncbi:MAG: hypothetical protein IJ542_00270 [Clostridia bacterium]|nr:hypothetical protein [Clostridia bacterium]
MISFNLDKFDINDYFNCLDDSYLELHRELNAGNFSDDERILYEAYGAENYSRAKNVMYSLEYLLEKIKEDNNDKYHNKFNAIRNSIHKALLDFIFSKDKFCTSFDCFSLCHVEKLIDNFSKIEDGYDGFDKQNIDLKNNFLYESLLRESKIDYSNLTNTQAERQ